MAVHEKDQDLTERERLSSRPVPLSEIVATILRRLTPLHGNADPIPDGERGKASREDAERDHAASVQTRAMRLRAEREARMERPRTVRTSGLPSWRVGTKQTHRVVNGNGVGECMQSAVTHLEASLRNLSDQRVQIFREAQRELLRAERWHDESVSAPALNRAFGASEKTGRASHGNPRLLKALNESCPREPGHFATVPCCNGDATGLMVPFQHGVRGRYRSGFCALRAARHQPTRWPRARPTIRRRSPRRPKQWPAHAAWAWSRLERGG
jgi:hypothetical protein